MTQIYPNYKFNYDSLETGDLLLFHWTGKCDTALNCCLTFYGKLISCFTKSRYTHSAIVIRNPPWRTDLKGLYILESSLETFPDAEDHEIKFGVQLVDFQKMIDDFQGNVYVRKLNCKRDQNFNENLIKAQSIVHNRSYDTIVLDYIKAGFKIFKGKVQRLKTFYCSSLVIFIYIKLGFLDKTLPWSVLAPSVLGTEPGIHHLTFKNCSLEPEVKIK